MQIRWVFSLLLVVFVSPHSAAAQESATPAADELQPVFSDDFSSDTRGDYTIGGDVLWEAGRLTLQPDASLGRTITAGARVRVDLTLEQPELTAENPQSELQVWFDLNEATDCFVRLRRSLTDQGVQATVALFDTGEQDGRPVTILVREVTIDNADTRRLSVEYRHGQVQMYADKAVVFMAYIQNGGAPVACVRVSGAGAELSNIGLLVTGSPGLANLTVEQQKQLKLAGVANARTFELYGQGNFSEAARVGEEVLQLLRTVFGDEHSHTAKAMNNLGLMYLSMGEYTKAEPLLSQCLKIHQKVLGEEHRETATNLNSLGILYERQFDYSKAEPLLRQSLEIRQKVLGEENLDSANGLNSLGMLYRSMGEYAKAEPLLRKSLEIYKHGLGSDHHSTARSLNNLGVLYRLLTEYVKAEPLIRESLEIRRRILGENHPDTVASLDCLASLYQSMGQYSKAEPLFRESLTLNQRVLGNEHPFTGTSFNNLSFLLWLQGNPSQARPFAERSLAIALAKLEQTAPVQTEQQQFLMTSQSRVYLFAWLTVTSLDKSAVGTWSEALPWKGLITARQQGLRLALKDDPLFAEFRQVTQRLSTVSLSPPQPPSDLEAIESWKAREPELRRNWESQKATLVAEHERLEKELAVKSVPFRENLEQRRVQPEELIATLKAQDRPTALIDILAYKYFGRRSLDESDERRIVAFVVRGDQPVVRVELGSTDAIAEQVTQWRKSIERKTGGVEYGAELRKLVWLPLEPYLEGIETVVISPDGPLAMLSWGALPGSKPDSFLIEDRAIAVIPAPQMLPSLLQSERRSDPPESLLLAGDIEYGGDPGRPRDLLASRGAIGRSRDGQLNEWGQLPQANAELASIERRYRKQVATGESSTLESREATESAFREQAPKHQWLHVITHGFFAPETVRSAIQSTDEDINGLPVPDRPQPVRGDNPGLLSGLVFAGANSTPEPEKDDGILTALEVSSLDLNQVDTVVLSACETGLGAVAGGEGLLGLQRAFQVAGAKTVVASLWKVPDAATARLMQRFYENLWDKKLGKLEALREAQLWMMKDQSARGAELIQDAADNARLPPEYWAAFVLSGDWR